MYMNIHIVFIYLSQYSIITFFLSLLYTKKKKITHIYSCVHGNYFLRGGFFLLLLLVMINFPFARRWFRPSPSGQEVHR